jgi:glycyl-tRNA synthetase
VDYDTLEGDMKGTVTIRDRDTTEQKRIRMDDAPAIIDDLITGKRKFSDL